MKALPYFRWYPADADADENFRAMDDAELGFYIRCLNHAWLNHGIPADPSERARCLRTRLDTANRRWERVGKCFVTSTSHPDRLVNPRQESEREFASRKSQLAMESVKVRYERTTNEPSRAFTRADSDSGSDSSVVISEKKSEGKLFAETAEIDRGALRPVIPTSTETFDRFWACWWNKTAKEEARKAWPAIAARFGAEFLIAECIADLARWEGREEWSWRAKLHPATWLRGQRWTDQLGPEVSRSVPVRQMSLADRTMARIQQRIVNGGDPL